MIKYPHINVADVRDSVLITESRSLGEGNDYLLQHSFHILNFRGKVFNISLSMIFDMASQVVLVVGDARDVGLIPGLGRGEGHGNPLQYSFLENPTDRGAWRATDHGVTKIQT